MNKKRALEDIKTLMVGSGLAPDWENDYWNEFSGSNICRFYEAMSIHFDLENKSFVLRNVDTMLRNMDSPSEAMEFYENHIDELLKGQE